MNFSTGLGFGPFGYDGNAALHRLREPDIPAAGVSPEAEIMRRVRHRSRLIIAVIGALSLTAGLAGSLQTALPADPAKLVLDPAQVLAGARSGVLDLVLAGGVFHFELEPHSIALGAVVGVDGIAVGRVTQTVTFSGTANGLPALVAATQAGVFLAIFGPDPVFVEPLWMSEPGAPLNEHRVLLWSPNPPVIPDHPDPAPVELRSNPAFDATEVVLPRNRTVRFLVESDAAFFDRFNPTGLCDLCWVEVQQAVMLIAEFNFRRDAHVRFNLTSQWACTSVAACPYDTANGNGDLGLWWGEFQNRWEGTTTEPAHDLGHLIVATDLTGGVGGAGTGVVGEPGGYAVSEFATTPTTDSLVHYVVATHEIGHNFNATHARAAPVPPILNPLPSQTDGKAWTVMMPGQSLRFQFSDGSHTPSLNNLAYILTEAAQKLPP